VTPLPSMQIVRASKNLPPSGDVPPRLVLLQPSPPQLCKIHVTPDPTSLSLAPSTRPSSIDFFCIATLSPVFSSPIGVGSPLLARAGSRGGPLRSPHPVECPLPCLPISLGGFSEFSAFGEAFFFPLHDRVLLLSDAFKSAEELPLLFHPPPRFSLSPHDLAPDCLGFSVSRTVRCDLVISFPSSMIADCFG